MYMIFQYNLKIWEFTMFHDLITRLTSKIKAIIMQPLTDSNFVSGAKRVRNVQVNIKLNTPPEKKPLQ